MRSKKKLAMELTLDFLAHPWLYQAVSQHTSGAGIIFTLHRVVDGSPKGFSPNRILNVSPEFLDSTITTVKSVGYDVVSIGEARKRLIDKNFDRKFACFTLDDGYLDNYTHAFPIFQKHNVPFTIYINSGLLEGSTILWWQHLEDIVKSNIAISLKFGRRQMRFQTQTDREKYNAYENIYWAIRAMTHTEQTDAISTLLEKYNIDCGYLCRNISLTWEHVKRLNSHELVTIGAHTMNHYALSKLSADQVQSEIEQGQLVMEKRIGYRSRHFAYPFGDRKSAGVNEFKIAQELDLDTAVTQRKGVLVPEHANHLYALPRVSLNGDFQKLSYVPLFLSGLPFKAMNMFSKIDVY